MLRTGLNHASENLEAPREENSTEEGGLRGWGGEVEVMVVTKVRTGNG